MLKYVGTALLLAIAGYSTWRYVIDRGRMGPPTIGQDTTWVDGPVLPDGYIDYFAAANEFRARGIRPEDNAAIDLIRAIGPANDIDTTIADQWKILKGEAHWNIQRECNY